MKALFKKIIQWYLGVLASRYLNYTRPQIVGITGTFGKTSTKEAVYTAIKDSCRVHCSDKSLNTEIGFALSVLGLQSGFSSPVAWLKILLRGTWLSFFPVKKYEVMVLEYGADKPGDIEYLLKIAKPNIGIITCIGQMHLDKGQFKNIDAIFSEKKKLVERLGAKDLAIINSNDSYLRKIKTRARIQKYGIAKDGNMNGFDICATNIRETLDGTVCDINVNGKHKELFIPVLGGQHIEVVIPAILVGMRYKIPLKKIIERLRGFTLPPGRMGKIEGINGSVLIDSSYNSSPPALAAALKLLKYLPAKRKIAVLGNMNELGDFSKTAHLDIGKLINGACDMLLTVGEYARLIGEDALKRGFDAGRIKFLHTAEEAGKYLKAIVEEGDIILFKGSQNKVRLEKAIKMIMAHPEKASTLLCRQEREWSHKD